MSFCFDESCPFPLNPNYLIDYSGRIWSCYTKRLLKTHGVRGDWSIKLLVDGESRWFAISRLVAMCFIENPDNLPIVDHIDFDHNNNHVSNLRWISRQRSQQYRRGYGQHCKGVYNSGSKLNPYRAVIYTDDGKHQDIRYFKTKEEASQAYKEVATQIRGEYARIS